MDKNIRFTKYQVAKTGIKPKIKAPIQLNEAVRKEIIDLFFEGEKFHGHTLISFFDTLYGVEPILEDDSNKEDARILKMGDSFEEVEKKKRKNKIVSKLQQKSIEPIENIDFQRKNNTSEPTSPADSF